MLLGTLQVRLHIPQSRSLKAKRFVLQSLITKVRTRFNVSVAEIGDQDLWQSAFLGVAAIGNEKRHLNSVLSTVADFITKEEDDFLVTDSKMELI
ncbi:MAG TPA: DUF503 domain-containing protein [Candidatus Omnitrophota bacterium]|nr:DUF503 domain-containing protein [Candidatus Omnitrophota bacterium]